MPGGKGRGKRLSIVTQNEGEKTFFVEERGGKSCSHPMGKKGGGGGGGARGDDVGPMGEGKGKRGEKDRSVSGIPAGGKKTGIAICEHHGGLFLGEKMKVWKKRWLFIFCPRGRKREEKEKTHLDSVKGKGEKRGGDPTALL